MRLTLPVISVNGVLDAQISPLDRGFAYGDGLFETCRMVNGAIPLWRYHAERLENSAKQLLIPTDIKTIQRYLQSLIDLVSEENLENAVVKIIVSRGVGGRGYKQPEKITPTVCVGIFPGVEYPQDYYDEGVATKICEQRLSVNVTVAGLKHLNRLEQVLARSEWQSEYAEGLLLNTRDYLIEGTLSNLFIVKQGKLITPDLTTSGVAGVMRRYILEEVAPSVDIDCAVNNITLSQALNADELFLCNSVFGVWPIKSIKKENIVEFPVGNLTRKLQHSLNLRLNFY